MNDNSVNDHDGHEVTDEGSGNSGGRHISPKQASSKLHAKQGGSRIHPKQGGGKIHPKQGGGKIHPK